MKKEELIYEIRTCCNHELAKIELPSTGGTIGGMQKRVSALKVAIEHLNVVLVVKANEYLKMYDGDDYDKVKEEVENILKESIESIIDKFNQ